MKRKIILVMEDKDLMFIVLGLYFFGYFWAISIVSFFLFQNLFLTFGFLNLALLSTIIYIIGFKNSLEK